MPLICEHCRCESNGVIVMEEKGLYCVSCSLDHNEDEDLKKYRKGMNKKRSLIMERARLWQ